MARAIWLQGITCNGNTHSFLHYEQLSQLLDEITFLYHPLLPSPLHITQLCYFEEPFDILVVEGAYGKIDRGGCNFVELFHRLRKQAKHVVAIGSCAVYGGILGERGINFAKEKQIDSIELINIPGCPAHPEWIAFALLAIKNGENVKKDTFQRPKEIYGYTVHSGCTRNEYFEWKVDAKSFGTQEGCLFYEQGCQAPFTHGSCNKILWNGVSSKTRIGTPCFGCTEPTFPSNNLFKTKTHMGIPVKMPLGVPKRAYLTLTGIAKSFHIPRLHKRVIDED
ncbi:MULTISPECIES: hydrogenase [unclassified Nitratiruptor]|uniref:NADH-quinone oxidoreductase subunit B family protein n=1 Tax=unclassified Nitratiruptor TaxID=2624044 RepID=UPI0019158703|nr:MULTISPECIES: hydrogenase [unclassified Nitratiruptor]